MSERITSILKFFLKIFTPKIPADEERHMLTSSLSYKKNPHWLSPFFLNSFDCFNFILIFKGYVNQPMVKNILFWSNKKKIK